MCIFCFRNCSQFKNPSICSSGTFMCQCFHLEQFVVHNLDMIPVFMWSAGTEVPTQLCAVSDSFGCQSVNCVTLTEMASGPSVNSSWASAASRVLWGGLALLFKLGLSVLGAVWVTVLTAAFCWRREAVSQSCWKGFLLFFFFWCDCCLSFFVENSKKYEVTYYN